MLYDKNYHYKEKIKELEEENRLLKMEDSKRNIEKIKLKYKNKIIPFREYVCSDRQYMCLRKKENMEEFPMDNIPFQEFMNKVDEIIDYINEKEDKNN